MQVAVVSFPHIVFAWCMYVLEWPIGDPTHVKTRPEPEGFGVGSGQVRHFMIRGFSGRVPEVLYTSGFFGSIPEKVVKTRTENVLLAQGQYLYS